MALSHLIHRRSLILLCVIIALPALAGIAYASHSWAGYHWARTSNPFTVKLGDNVTNAWDSYLATTSSDWSVSTVLDTTIVLGQGGKNCRASAGRIEVCNAKYGRNGWLGLASVWVNGSHITQGTAKMNDTYFNTPTYNSPAWKNLVMCQEVAHAFGLNHQDESFTNANLDTCMDYTNNPTSNQHPNAHDYEQLELTYEHLDSTTTLSASAPQTGAQESENSGPEYWGKPLHHDGKGRPSHFEKDLGKGQKVFTFVIWADEEK